MHQLLRLVCFMHILQFCVGGTKILIIVEHGESTWYGLGEVYSVRDVKWSVAMLKTENGKNTANKPSDYKPDWSNFDRCKFAFVLDAVSTTLYTTVVSNQWVEAKISLKEKSRGKKYLEYSFQLQGKVTPVSQTANFKLQGVVETIFSGSAAGITLSMLFMMNWEDSINFQKILDNKTMPIFQLENNASMSVSVQIESAAKISSWLVKDIAIFVVNCYEVIDENHQDLEGPECECYVRFWSNKTVQYATATMHFDQLKENGTLWINKIWNPETTGPTYQAVSKNHINILRTAGTLDVAVRNSTEKNPADLSQSFVSPVVIPSLNTRLKLTSNQQIGINFSFGKRGQVTYELNGKIESLPVNYDKKSKTLTFVGKNVIETFDIYQKATKLMTKQTAASSAGKNEPDVVMTLLEFPGDNAPSKAVGKIAIYSEFAPTVRDKNVFNCSLFQRKYFVSP